MNRTLPAVGMFALLVFIIALNLRPIMAAMGPLFPLLQRDAQLSATQLSLLTTLPVIMMGLAALAGPLLLRQLGEVRGIAAGLALLALASIARGFDQSATMLIISALVAGSGIGLIQALMPAQIKRHFGAKAGTLMALFTTGIMAGAAIAAASAAPLANAQGLALTLAIPVVPAIIALLLWLTVSHGIAPTQSNQPPRAARSERAWLLMIFFGIGTGAYTLVLAWLPPFYMQHGWQPEQSGYVLGALTLTEVAAGFVLSALIHRFRDRRRPLLVVLTLILLGLISLLTLGGAQAWLPTLLLGLGIGALFPLSLIVTLDHAHTPEEAGALLSFVQGGGYLLAALMPLIAGIVRDRAASLDSAWVMMSVGIVLLMVMAQRFKPQR
ncbi:MULTISPECIES: MFS transporter [unclassified Enterobacter]|uniref:MFS transporter n=1 Tax=unclassified Enterobacter TaxID=2608935 RepID=UPI001824FD7C|nr:CP family cyanate transporter-like MFS transporter [Enterobacter sp. Sphag1F]NYI16085.1 CP family cyanate transporter-like MFS transporter [Enterobacter sp. Sphag71]